MSILAKSLGRWRCQSASVLRFAQGDKVKGLGWPCRTSLDPERRSQQAKGQRDGQIDDLEDAVNGDAEDAEREQEQPDEGIGNQSQQGQGPAEDEQDAPEQESEHGEDLLLYMIVRSRREESSSGRGRRIEVLNRG